MTRNHPLFRILEHYGTHLNHPGKWRIHAKMRTVLNVNIDADLEVVRAGLNWVLNPSDYMQSGVFWLGAVDVWELFHLKRLLRPGSVILDIGANFGYYSIILASHLRKHCRVLAVEPDPSNHARLVDHIARNELEGVVTAHCFGLSDKPGFATRAARAGNSGSTNLSESDEATETRLTSLDAFIADQNLDRLDFMKIDVEGFEERVLRGAREALTRFQPLILIELEPPRLALKGSSVPGVADLLYQAGYRLFISHRNRLLPLRSLPVRDDEQINAFALHPDRHRLG